MNNRIRLAIPTAALAGCLAITSLPGLLAPVAPAAAGALPLGAQMTVAPIVSAVMPGVVSIANHRVEKIADPLLQDPSVGEMFSVPDSGTRREVHAAGSGVIVDSERGYVLTNAHVVKGANLIEVTTYDKRKFKGELVGSDPETDVAVLRIKADRLTAIPLGDSDRARVGDFVLAVGNPYGLGQTVTSGIVSALGRTGLGIEGYEDFIQTDASINPGNSGGALVALDGRLIGISTAILSRTGGNVGIGFAVPINMARSVMEQIIAHGQVKRGRIGVALQDVTPDRAEARGIVGEGGAMISAVETGSPAAQAGLSKGDVVTTADNVAVRSASHLRNMIGLHRVGTTVAMIVRRKDAPAATVSVRIEAAPSARAVSRHHQPHPAKPRTGELRSRGARG